MKIRVVGRVQQANHHAKVPEGEYNADLGEVMDANRRYDNGIVLTAPGRVEYEVQMYDWKMACKTGKIVEIKEG